MRGEGGGRVILALVALVIGSLVCAVVSVWMFLAVAFVLRDALDALDQGDQE